MGKGEIYYAVIVDREGTIIAFPDTTFVSERVNIKSLAIIEQTLAHKKNSTRFRFLETDYIGGGAVVESTGWPVVVFQSVEEAFFVVRRTRYFILLSIVVAAAVAFIISRLSIRRVVNPLSQLVKNARKIAGGDYSVTMRMESYLEINELAEDFSRMAKAIKNREEELKRAQTFLDSIIENIPNMVFVKDARTLKFVSFNKAGEELLGFPRVSMIGKTDYDFHPPEEAEIFISRDYGDIGERIIAGHT